MSKKKQIKKEDQQLINSLSGLIDNLTYGNPFTAAQVSDLETMFKNNRWYMLSNNRNLLSQLYVEHGLVQTLIDQPVQDAFRAGYEIKSSQLGPEDIQTLMANNESERTNETIIQGFIWNRLYGGAGIMILTGQDPTTPLQPLKKGDLVEFKAVDMWELFYDKQNVEAIYDNTKETLFNYYGKQVHSSRIILLKGREAPSFIRPRLRGWGMSELERFVRSFNSYLKNQDLIFEMLDEAKIDVYKMSGYNSALATSAGTDKLAMRIQQANMLKNYQNAITMDKEDEYEQKTMAFSGLSDIYVGLKQGVAADLKMPMTKLFGQSTAGFSSGADEIENYNAMIEGEVRSKAKPAVIKLQQIKCQSLFGFTPTDLAIDFPSLRILSAEQEENVKTQKATTVNLLFTSGLISAEEARASINKENLISISLEG